MASVLFVCLGNICRSPMAEAVFLHKVRLADLQDKITADSAGTGGWHAGSEPHHGTRAVLDAESIEYRHAARTITPDDFRNFDIICVMDEDNFGEVTRLQTLGKMSDGAKVVRLMQFAPRAGYKEVPDPYYDGNFGRTFELVSSAADGLLTYIREQHAL